MTDNFSGHSNSWLEARHLPVLYEDEDLLVVNKPAGLPSLPDGYVPEAPHLRALLEPIYGRLWIVHRLDRETSGLIVLARSTAAHRSLNTQFEKHVVIKRYHALVCGCPAWEGKTTRAPLRPNGDRRHRTIVDQRLGKPAETELKILERFGKFCFIEALPHSGRTHQIRAHLAALGLPILGDWLYGGQPALFLSMIKPGFHPGIRPECALIQRCALHAWTLEFSHPTSGEALQLLAPYPRDMRAVLRMLSRYPA